MAQPTQIFAQIRKKKKPIESISNTKLPHKFNLKNSYSYFAYKCKPPPKSTLCLNLILLCREVSQYPGRTTYSFGKIDKIASSAYKSIEIEILYKSGTSLPENADTTAAMAKETTTAGPAIDLATAPANTYTPHPKVEPVPNAVKSKKVKTRLSFSLLGSSESVFFLVNAHVNESVCWTYIIILKPYQNISFFVRFELGAYLIIMTKKKNTKWQTQ